MRALVIATFLASLRLCDLALAVDARVLFSPNGGCAAAVINAERLPLLERGDFIATTSKRAPRLRAVAREGWS